MKLSNKVIQIIETLEFNGYETYIVGGACRDEILDRPVKDIDLVTEEYQNLAAHRYKTEYSKLEKEANLSFFDKIARNMGFETKKTKALEDAQKAFKKEKGLELLKQDSPEIFKDKVKKMETYIKASEKDATKYFNNNMKDFSIFAMCRPVWKKPL